MKTGRSNVRVWALGLSCGTPAAPPDRAAEARTRQPENSKRAHLSVPALQTPPKFNEKTPRERRKNEISGGREQKKSEILGLQLFGPHPSGPHHPSGPQPFGPPPFGPPPPTLRAPLFLGSGPHPSAPPPLRAPTPPGPPPTKLAKCGLAKFGLQKLAKFGQIRMAKSGLAKCGHGPIGSRVYQVVGGTNRPMAGREIPRAIRRHQWSALNVPLIWSASCGDRNNPVLLWLMRLRRSSQTWQ